MDHDEEKRENFESSMDLLEERGAVEDEEEEEAVEEDEEGILEADISDTVVDETAEDDELYISSVDDGVEPGGSGLDVKLEPMSPPPSPTSICQIENVVSGSADVDICEDEDPKDIELEYDDTIETVVDSRRELGIRKCDILLPNFKYKTKHLNSAKRFPVGKLKNSHPEFFKKKGNGKKTSSSKSMGGGFAVKALIKKEKEEETPSKKSAKASKKPMKEEWIKAPQKPLIKSEKKESVSDTSCDPVPSSTPNLKEVTIKNLRVGVERLHKNIVNFKYKQYKEFMDKQNPPTISTEDDNKKKKSKDLTPKKGKKANVKIKNEPASKSDSKPKSKKVQESPKSTKESSRLFEKFGINTDTSSDSEDEKESPVKTETKINGTPKPQKPEQKSHKKLNDPKPSGKRKISTEKRKISSEKRKSLSADKSEDEDLSKESSVITNPFFQTDLPPEGKERQEKEKEKLVEMLFSLIKGSKPVSGVTIKTEVTEEVHKKTSISEPRKTSISETTPNKTPILETTPNTVPRSETTPNKTPISETILKKTPILETTPNTIPRSETTPNKTPIAEPISEKTSENSISMPKASEIKKASEDSSVQNPEASVEPTPTNSSLDNTSTRTQEPEKHIEPLISDPFEQLFSSSQDKSEKSASEKRSSPVKELENFQVPEASIFAGGDDDFFDDACIDDREGSPDGAVSDHDENIPAFAFTKSSEIERKKWLLPNLFKQTPELQLLRALLELHSEDQRILTRSSMTLGELENSMQSAIDNINQLVIDTKIDKVKRKKKDYRRLRTFNMRGVQVNIKNVKNEDTAAYEKALKVFNERNGENIYLWDYDRKSRLIINSQSSVKKRFIRSRSLSSSSSDNSPVRNREPSPSPKPKKSVEQGSDSETDSQKESNKKAEKHQKKPELKRGKDEKKNRDPNKFKIPKVSQVAENKQTLKSILEEGLKKGVSTPQKSYHSPQTRHVGRYQDWRKEQRIKEVVRKKEKVIDIKKIEEQIAKPAAAPNFVDNILSSMDKLTTHKPENARSTEKLDSEKSNPMEKPSPARELEELALQEKKLKEREADKIRHQEKRIKDLAENMIAPANPMTDLTSDEWGAPIGKSQLHRIVPKLKTSAPAEVIDDNSDDDLPEPVSAVADDDDFPVPVPSIPLSPRSIQNKDGSKHSVRKDPVYNHEKVMMDQHVSESNDDYTDDYNDDNGGGFDDYDDDDDQTHQVAKVVESPVKTVESKKFVRDRSRTPSPFLRCNRYYPEFYAKKVAKETAPKSIQSTIPSTAQPLTAVPAPVPHPYSTQHSAQVRPPDPVPVPFPPTPVPAPSSSSILSSVRFPSDIDQRIAKHFRDKRSKEQSRKRKSENEAYEPSTSPLWQASLEEKRLPVPKGKTFKDFQIDPMDSFMLNPPKDIVGSDSDVESKDLGSRLAGAGLGVFINKVISSLKTTKKEDSMKIKRSGGLYLPSLRTDDEDYERERPSHSNKLSPHLDDLPPLPPDPVVDLEPGELPDSPPRPPPDSPPHSHYDDDDDSSTINVLEADLDDSMILEIVGELDDTLEEEEKLFRAKEKLAKHLLKKKSDLSSTWESKKPMSERGHSVRKMMIMQLPNQSKPAVPDIIQALNQPPPPPPHLLQQVMPQVQDYARSNNHQVDDNDIDSFASSWGFQDNSQEENAIAEPPQDEGFSSAISKLRGARPPPVPHMSSALEKLRSMKRRTILESPFYEPSPKRERLQDMNSPSVSRVLDEFMEPEKFTNPLFNFRNEMKTGQSNINARFNDVENFNGPRGGGLLPAPRFDPGSEREQPPLNPMFQNSSQINNMLVDNSWINKRDAPFPQNPQNLFNKSNSSNIPNMNLQSDMNRSNFHHRPTLFNSPNSSNLPNLMNKSSDVNPTNPAGGRQPFPNGMNEINRPGFMNFPNPGNKTGLLGHPNDHDNHQNFSSDFNRPGEQGRVPFQQNTRQTPPRDFFNGESRTNFNGSNSRLEEQPGSDGSNSIQLQDDSEAHLADQLHNRLTTVTEREYLEKFMFDWNMLLRTEFQSQLLNFRRKQSSDEPSESAEIYDLGKEFNDYRLNQQVKDPQGGPDKDVFISSLVEGNLQLKCEICNITVLGKRNMEGHMFGKKHKTKLEEFTIVENSEGPRKPPAVVPKSPVTDPGPISSLLKQYKAAPLIGLEYIVEIVGEKGEPDYACLLCKFECKTRELMYHLLSAHHRLFYLSRFFPSARTKFSKVPNRRFWEKPTYDFLDSVINRIEFKFGRKSTFVLLAQHGSLEVEKKKLMNKLEEMEHFSECPLLDFGSLPDPFGAYINRIPRHQIQL